MMPYSVTANIAQADLGMNGSPSWTLYQDDYDHPVTSGDLAAVEGEGAEDTLARIEDAIEGLGYTVGDWSEETGWTLTAEVR